MPHCAPRLLNSGNSPKEVSKGPDEEFHCIRTSLFRRLCKPQPDELNDHPGDAKLSKHRLEPCERKTGGATTLATRPLSLAIRSLMTERHLMASGQVASMDNCRNVSSVFSTARPTDSPS